ncbi:unnamed protein product, partial [Mesorhabditis belari]|uniref:Protein amnionless n=1 Tax=Mesorhabditis belari TaxID=2138241 RepID=A0AAF3F7A8_9BILA
MENWKDQSFPCNDDRILITSMNEMSAMIDVDINVEETVFPDNGVLFFGDRVKLQQGRPGWFDKQKSCDTVVGSDYETRDSRDAYFEETDFLSVYNPSSWHSDGDRNLHMNLVPSQRDDVLVGDTLAIQMSIEDTWNLRSLQMNGRVSHFSS